MGLRGRAEAVRMDGDLNRKRKSLADMPLQKVYRWWQQQSGNQHMAQDNLCHYFRVVMIWAPLRALLIVLKYVGMVVICLAIVGAIGALIIAGFRWWQVTLMVLAGLATAAYIVFAFRVASNMFYDVNMDFGDRWF